MVIETSGQTLLILLFFMQILILKSHKMMVLIGKNIIDPYLQLSLILNKFIHIIDALN